MSIFLSILKTSHLCWLKHFVCQMNWIELNLQSQQYESLYNDDKIKESYIYLFKTSFKDYPRLLEKIKYDRTLTQISSPGMWVSCVDVSPWCFCGRSMGSGCFTWGRGISLTWRTTCSRWTAPGWTCQLPQTAESWPSTGPTACKDTADNNVMIHLLSLTKDDG